MGIPKKKSRRINVRGQDFRWLLGGYTRYWGSSYAHPLLTVQLDDARPGRVMQVQLVCGKVDGMEPDLDAGQPSLRVGVTPKTVAQAIQTALESGWDPMERGAAFVLPEPIEFGPPAVVGEDYKIPYKGNLEWLPGRTIFFVTHGSRAYGTNRPDSDHDLRGVAVAPRPYRDGFLQHFEQAECREPDMTIFSLPKFFSLAADCNPNVLELLYVPKDCIHICTWAGSLLVENRQLFLSRKALYTFRGYAMQQLRRIKTHRRWLLDPKEDRPLRSAFGLPDDLKVPTDQLGAAMSRITKKMDGWEIDFGDLDEATKIYVQDQMRGYMVDLAIGSDERFQVAARLLGYDENFLEYLLQEKRFRQAQEDWKKYQDWKKNRNPARAAMEAKFGYDGKHGLHLVRLMRMCKEVLTEGIMRVRRPDADELKGFLEGSWSYEKLITWAEEQDHEMIGLAQKSDLPKKPNRTKLDELCQEITAAVG